MARESWLRSCSDTRFADAMMVCQHAGAFCAADGYCHYDGSCFRNDKNISDRLDDLEEIVRDLTNKQP